MPLRRIRCLLGFFLLLSLVATPAAHAGAPAPLGGGSLLETSTSRCTAGFAATGGGTGYLIASGSCGKPGDAVRSAGRPVGVVSSAPYPPNGAIVIRVTNTTDWRLVGTIPPSGGTAIAGSVEAPVGSSVCRYSALTGWRCGVIQAKNQTITYPEGTVTGLTRTSVCVERGDTGGPYVSGTQAQGVLVGGTGNCDTGGSSYFLPVNRVLSIYGLTLLTR